MAKCNHYFSWNGFFWVCVSCGARSSKNPYKETNNEHKDS